MEESSNEIKNDDKKQSNKREFTTLKKRKEVLDYIKNEKSTITAASLYFNIPRTTIEYWVKTEDNIREDPKDKKHSTHKGPKLKFEEYEEEIYNWITFNMKEKLPITIYAIDKKLRELNSDFEADKLI